MIKGVHSVVIWTEDLGRLVPFYRDVVGLKQEMDAEGFAVFAGEQGPQLALGQHSEVKGASRDPNRVMVNLGVVDAQAEYERLTAKGVKFTRPPSEDAGGMVIATFLDPDGNTLQLFQTG